MGQRASIMYYVPPNVLLHYFLIAKLMKTALRNDAHCNDYRKGLYD